MSSLFLFTSGPHCYYLLFTFALFLISLFFFLFFVYLFLFFFFSSRRRHTRWNCDWSSDVCSSDLIKDEDDTVEFTTWTVRAIGVNASRAERRRRRLPRQAGTAAPKSRRPVYIHERSEERRVGKECRSRWSRYQEREKREG